MHKSKNYDMATQVAMDKLMPKPIQISISMKGGGGLSSINKPISINGKRHNLAWINSDEASVLKAMGGSGKKVDGIPAYFYDDPGSMQSYLDVAEEAPGEDIEYLTDNGTTIWQDEARGLTADLADWATYGEGTQESTDSTSSADTSDAEERQTLLDRPELNIYKNQLIERLGGKGMEDYLKGLGTSDLKTMIDKWHTGYDFGGPMGTMEGLSREIGKSYEKKLKFKDLAKELKELKERNL